MNEFITEKQYPIRNIWLFKRTLPFLVLLPISLIFVNYQSKGDALPLSAFFLIVVLVFSFEITGGVLRRLFFHYSLEQHFIVLHQGIISKQNRNVPYGRIQGVFVNQGLFDRIFGLASLTIEDFSQGGTSAMDVAGYVVLPTVENQNMRLFGTRQKRETLGFMGNRIHIPGLKKGDAEALKEIILQKIKENPIEDSQSGL